MAYYTHSPMGLEPIGLVAGPCQIIIALKRKINTVLI